MKKCIMGVMSAVFVLGQQFAGGAEKVDFSSFKNPRIFKGTMQYAYRDPAVIYHDGRFHMYFTLVENMTPGKKNKQNDSFYWTTAYSSSADLVNWTEPKEITPRDQSLNFSSPGNVVKFGDEFILCLQTYPRNRKERRIFIMRSKDLENWSEAELLKVKGPDVSEEDMGSMIDPYLIQDKEGMWWCFYKQKGVSYSKSKDLKTWEFVGRAHAGENVSVIERDDEYYLFHSAGSGVHVKKSGNLFEWPKENILNTSLGQDDWPWANARLTAATVVDLTGDPKWGKYVMFFHASYKEAKKVDTGHGAASMCFAWSDDLMNWEWPGKNRNN